MTSADRPSISTVKLHASIIAVLTYLSTSAACATTDRDLIIQERHELRNALREARQELRLQRKEDNFSDRLVRMQNRDNLRLNRSGAEIGSFARSFLPPSAMLERQIPRFSPTTSARLKGFGAHHADSEVNATTAVELSARNTFITESGKTKSLTRGVDLDLSSTDAHIIIGENYLTQSVSIEVGGVTKMVSAGSKVTAAEYVALNQKLSTGTQLLSLSANGSASGGTLNLNLISDEGNRIRASELVIPKDVLVTGDFSRTADGVRVTHDLVNHGSIVATSSERHRTSAFIGARDILNEQSGSIKTVATLDAPALDLILKAERDFANEGSISSSGSLEISAGRQLRNSASVVAMDDVNLNAPVIANQGSISATGGNVRLSGPAESALQINNYGGVINALNGSIDIRTADYAGTSDSTLYGGNLFSETVNVFAGNGIANLTANDVSGVLNTSGLGAHVSVSTDELVLGTQCLTGDPTYYNTGSISLAGDITVGEKLAIIAGGSISSSGTGIAITARDLNDQGYDITIVAGANIISGSGEAPFELPGQPPISNNATGPVSISGNTLLGGSIYFGGQENATVTISSASTSGNRNGGNVLLAAMAGNDNQYGGAVRLGPNSTINASGSGTGNNGNVTIIAGGTNGFGIEVDNIINDGGSGVAGGVVNLIAAQPVSSDGLPVTFDTGGSITSGNSLIASSTAVFGGIAVQQISSKNDVTLKSTNIINVDAITTRGTVTVTSDSDITIGSIDTHSALAGVSAGSVVLSSNQKVMVTSIDASDDATGNGANVSVNANQISLDSIDASGSPGGNGGAVSLVGGTGGVVVGELISSGAIGGAISVASTDSDIVISTGVKADNGGELNIALNGATPGDADVEGNFEVSSLKLIGGGNIQLDAGANPIYLDAVGTNQTLNFSTTNVAVGIENNAVIATTGSLNFNTPRFANNADINADTVSVYSDGDLAIVGNGSTITASNETRFDAAAGANLRLFGTMNFNGDLLLRSVDGTVTSEAGSLYVGNNDVTLTAFTWTQLGGGNIIGNQFIMGGLSIVNPTGDVTLLSDQNYFGRDLAIVAFGNINLGSITINLSSTTGDAGSLSLFAGYNQFFLTGGQQVTQTQFSVGNSGASGSVLAGDVSIFTNSTAGDGGNVVAVSSTGTVELGNIDSSSSVGSGGAVTIIAPQGVQAADIISTGAIGDGDVTITSSTVTFVNNFVTIDAGTLVGGVEPNPFQLTAYPISTGSISAGSGLITLKNAASPISTGTLSANWITVRTAGAFNYGDDIISANMSASGNGGRITIDAESIESIGPGPLSLVASGTADGGFIELDLKENVVLGTAGDLVFDARGGAAGGGVYVETTGSLSLDSGGLQVAGQNGRGASLSLTAGGTLALNDTSAFADVDATGSNGNGGILILDGGDVIFQSSLSSPLVLSANGIGTGNGGSIRFSNGSAGTTIIGSPAVGVSPDSNFLQISAVSGLSGGHGGNANITTGGALVVETSGLNVAPRSSTGNWDGGGLYISAERNLDKTGTVYIEGNLNVDGVGTGDGGFISIVASSKTDLVLGPTKGTVNGIFGSLSAMGGNGSISIRNNAGGILIDTSTALNASEVQLAAGDRGNISNAKGAVLTAPGSLKLSTTGTGYVGKKVLLVNAPVLSLSSLNGSVNVEDLHTSTVTLGLNSAAGKDFNLTTAGSLTVQQNLLLRTTAGDINLTAKTGTLFLDQNSHLEARKGAINILNEDTANGDILIYPGSEIETNSKGRNITISIGKARKEREPVPPIFVVSTEGNGKAFFSTGVEAPTASLVNANNRSVIFYNGSTNPAKKIQVYDSTITADKN